MKKIHPSRIHWGAYKPDGTPNDNNRVEIGPTDEAFLEWGKQQLSLPKLDAMREFRLKRITNELQKRDLAAVLLFDPLNIRYATDSTNMQLWVTHNHVRACLVTAAGYIVLWDFHNGAHLSSFLPLVKEVRHGASFFYFESGDLIEQQANSFAQEVLNLLKHHGNGRLAVDKIEIAGLKALKKLNIDVRDGQEVMEHARAIKGVDEIKAMRCAIASTESAISKMHAIVEPGKSENEIWATLHYENIRHGGEWIECRLLSSGPRTNPWFQECGPRIVEKGDILAFDTDLIGPYGMCVDISRTWVVGDQKARRDQQQSYLIALDHIHHNTSILRPNITFSELTRKAHRLPKEYRAQRYGVLYHGVGLCDEYPSIRYPEDANKYGYEGILLPGMVVCVEVYAGKVGDDYGIKLENQVLITETGHELLTKYPIDRLE